MPSFPLYYRDAFDPEKHRAKPLFQEGEYFFAQDLNEGLSAERHSRRGLADAIFRDGQVLRGAQILVNAQTGATTLDAGQVYVQGMMRDLAAATLTIPVSGEVLVGVILETRVVTSLEDPELIGQNFPTRALDAHGLPRADWLVETPRWGSTAETLADTADVAYSFFAVYTVRDGVVVDTAPATDATAFSALVERYDRESNGHYVARGCGVTYLDTTAGAQNYSLAEGVANVDGRKIDRPSSVRLTYVEDPDLERINAEPHLFTDGGSGSLVITLNRTPIATIHDVSVLTEKTVSVTRGQSSGGRDPLPDAQIQQIMEVKQGGTTYTAVTSYNRLGDEIDWSPAGSEPSPGSSYSVTYRYKKSIAPTAQTATTVTVAGAVTGSEVDIDYSWKMPRFDLIALDRLNAVHRIKGVASPYNPQRPSLPAGLLELAEIEQRWTTGYPLVRDTAIQALPKSDLKAIRDAVVENRQELARIRLQSEASARNPAAVNGIFADNFDNDDQRDAGIAQTASIVNGELTLSIAATLDNINTGGNGWTLNYTLEDVIVQPLFTRAFKINPYQSFAPVPAKVTLTPSIDEWVEIDTQWASPITQTIMRTPSQGGSGSTSTDVLLSRSTVAAEFLRTRSVEFSISGFGAGEQLATLKFDGIDVTPNPKPAANNLGVLAGLFTVPANIPAGTKTVEAVGAGGSRGTATYTGRGTITIEERRRVTTIFQQFDPVYQSFTAPPEGMHFGGFVFRFAEIGNKNEPVVVQLRDAVQGQPGRTVLAEVTIDMHQVNTVADVELVFSTLPWIDGGVEVTVVWLTNDADHAIAVAELGKFDAHLQRWVTAQPYQVGVFGSSSNNRAWTIHQELDAYFKVRRPVFTQSTRTIELGTIQATALTDILALAGVDIPAAATGVDLIFERPNGQQIKLAPGAVVSLDTALNENLTVKAILRGVANASPILFPDPLIVLGVLSASDTYVSRAFNCGSNRTVQAEYRARIPGTATVAVHVQQTNGTWTSVPLDSVADDSEGYKRYTHKLTGFSAPTTRVRVTLTGSALHRPRVSDLVVMPLTV
ncbi:DUF4815 domain-containing protein [Rhizobium sp. YJ-22]|uniref:DUF4815 domain-containing protein n=1 Tax=Rhizobium sp. YJ-22 TaxID=3037556 RepID=UPI002412B3A4|nr:DUF4815 domain-containing protein [Rhizobium sp. YJ-22]MDG3575971.1 DUF4815 domain-containing protein [Rhizobium sp. YJ-22]